MESIYLSNQKCKRATPSLALSRSGRQSVVAFLLLFLVSLGASAQVSGIVFRDFDGDGKRDGTLILPSQEPLIPGVIVRVYNAAGVLCGSDTTAGTSAPNWSVAGCGTGDVRVEFILPTSGQAVNSNVDFSALGGAVYGSSIQFVKGNATNVNFGLTHPDDYNLGSLRTNVYVPCYQQGDPLPAVGVGALDWFVGYPHVYTGANPVPPVLKHLNGRRIGATWGVAYSKQSKKIFTSAMLKRHVGLGTLGSGGIYIIDESTFAASDFYDLDANGFRTRAGAGAPAYGDNKSFDFFPGSFLIPTKTRADFKGAIDPVSGQPVGLGVIGSNDDRGLKATPGLPSFDPAAFDQVGKVSLGDLEISDDGKYLFVTNLYSRKVLRLTLNDPKNPTGVTAVTEYALPAVTVTNGKLRPWALSFHRGKLYVGAVTTGEDEGENNVPGGKTDLYAYVFEMNDPTGAANFSATPALTYPLNFIKGPAATLALGVPKWNPWSRNTFNFIPAALNIVYPQPILSDIEFSDRGDMIIGFSDRAGHQWGNVNYQNLSGLLGVDPLIIVAVGGDIQIAGLDAKTDKFTLENRGAFKSINGETYPPVSLPGTNLNGQGPGGGEFFYLESFPPIAGIHMETAQGGLAVLKGDGNVMLTVIDPIVPLSGGTTKFSTSNALVSSPYTLYVTTFGKANGLGDLELSGVDSPIEIGNRVWEDTDKDGIQDAGEPPIAGIKVDLCLKSAPTVPVATATTDANGNYYFSSQPGTSTPSVRYGINMLFQTDYILKFPTTSGVKTLTVKGAGPDRLTDSDADAAGQIAFTTGTPGQNYHGFDVGYSGCDKPDAGPDSTIACANNQLPTAFDLKDALAGQKYVVGTIPGGASVSVLSPSGNVSGTIVAGTYQFILQTQSDSIACRDTVNITIAPCAGCVKPNAGPDQNIACTSGQLPTSLQLVAAQTGQMYRILSPVPPGASVSVSSPSGAVTGTITAGTYRFVLQTQSDSINCRDTVQVIVQPCAFNCVKPSAGPDQTVVCNGEAQPASIDLTDAGSNEKWKILSFPVGASLNVTTPNGLVTPKSPATSLPAGVYQFVLQNQSDSLNCRDTVSITVPNCTTPCTPPTRLVTVTDPSCTATGNLSLTSTNGDKYGISAGPAYTGPAYATATAVPGTLPAIIKANLSNSADSTYTVRVFNRRADCFKDTTITVKAAPVKPTVSVTPGFPVCRANNTYSIKFTATGGTVSTVPGFPVTGDSIAGIPRGTASVLLRVISAAGCEDSVVVTAPVCDRPVGSIGDYVWKDRNNNGLQDLGEPGVDGVKLNLYNAVGGTKSGLVLDSKNTDGQGKYLFTNLTAGSYIVEIDQTTLPDTCLITPTKDANANGNDKTDSDFDPINGLSQVVTLNPVTLGAGSSPADSLATNNMTVDAGLITKPRVLGSIGDYVWKDKNDNGLQDNGEPGVSGVKLNLYTVLNGVRSVSAIASDTTDASGKYLFDKLVAGDYIVEIVRNTIPDTCAITLRRDVNANGNDKTDSDFDAMTGLSQIVTLDPVVLGGTSSPADSLATNNLTVDAGLVTKPVVCVKPVIGPITTTAATCATGQTGSNSNAAFVLRGISGGDRFSFATTVGGLAPYASATALTADSIRVGNLPNPGNASGQTYTVRVYNGKSDCFRDTTLTIGFVDCGGELTYDLALDNSIDKKLVMLGDTVTYTIRVFNQGTAPATGVEVADTLAASLQFVSSSGAYNPATNIWSVGTVAAGDTVSLTIKAKVVAAGVVFNTAQISRANGQDVDSTPGNDAEGEDDLDRECFTVPVLLCRGEGSGVELTVPAKYTGVVWFRQVQGGPKEQVATGNTYTASESELGSYEYTYTSTSGTCPAGGCCPIILVVEDCCVAEICVPITVKKVRIK